MLRNQDVHRFARDESLCAFAFVSSMHDPASVQVRSILKSHPSTNSHATLCTTRAMACAKIFIEFPNSDNNNFSSPTNHYVTPIALSHAFEILSQGFTTEPSSQSLLLRTVRPTTIWQSFIRSQTNLAIYTWRKNPTQIARISVASRANHGSVNRHGWVIAAPIIAGEIANCVVHYFADVC
jgi:hypothetical protein